MGPLRQPAPSCVGLASGLHGPRWTIMCFCVSCSAHLDTLPVSFLLPVEILPRLAQMLTDYENLPCPPQEGAASSPPELSRACY